MILSRKPRNMINSSLTEGRFVPTRKVRDNGRDNGIDWVTLAEQGTIDLRGANLNGAELPRISLAGSFLTGANIRDANLEGADISVSWVGAPKHRPPEFYETIAGIPPVNKRGRMAGAALDHMQKHWEKYEPHDESADFSGSNLRNVNFENSMLSGVVFSGCDLSGAKFEGADLRNADFTNTILTGAKGLYTDNTMSFRGATISGMNLKPGEDGLCWNIHGGDFRGADLSGTDLSNTRFSNCDFTMANLRRANLEGCKLGDCRFHGADITGANIDDPQEFLRRGAVGGLSKFQ